jgi:hypothetical protein
MQSLRGSSLLDAVQMFPFADLFYFRLVLVPSLEFGVSKHTWIV